MNLLQSIPLEYHELRSCVLIGRPDGMNGSTWNPLTMEVALIAADLPVFLIHTSKLMLGPVALKVRGEIIVISSGPILMNGLLSAIISLA
jgi:hypothetical protein